MSGPIAPWIHARDFLRFLESRDDLRSTRSNDPPDRQSVQKQRYGANSDLRERLVFAARVLSVLCFPMGEGAHGEKT